MARTDIHREGALIPADYELVLVYSMPGTEEGMPVPGCGFDCRADWRHRDASGRVVAGEHGSGDCCVAKLRAAGHRFAAHGGVSNCTACGAYYRHGAVWRHVPTGEHIFLGHICSSKAEMFADRSEHELKLDRLRKAALAQLTRERNAQRREAFLTDNPGLQEALSADHYIVQDIKARFEQSGFLSERQVALVLKIAREKAERDAQPPEIHCPAPEGRHTFRGKVVSVKSYDGAYGTTLKCVVKVTEGDGRTWLAWGTAPRGCLDSEHQLYGSEVEIKATLKRGNDAHFAFFKRPNGRVIAPPSC